MNVISHQDVCFHMYADDMQLYIGFDPKSDRSVNHTVKKLEPCLDKVNKWMLDNYMKLNKTGVMVITSRHHLQNTPIEHMTLGEEILVPSKVKNLHVGVTLNSFLHMEEHVNKLCQSINFHLKHWCMH